MRLLWHRYLWTSPGDPSEEHALTSWTWRTCTPREYMQRPAAKEREIPSRSSLLFICVRGLMFSALRAGCSKMKVKSCESLLVSYTSYPLHSAVAIHLPAYLRLPDPIPGQHSITGCPEEEPRCHLPPVLSVVRTYVTCML